MRPNAAIHDTFALRIGLDEDRPEASAGRLLNQVMEVVESLSQFPERGTYPKELAALGNKEFRRARFKPDRVIYRVTGEQVVIYLIADGRRDMQSVLARRLLGA